ncbi:hypothetical protein NLJ89_g9209 [Agrocybe chaxingu]|uniref:Uncharacterized protein n=1 Tax=Agrocybe chaxingu TaxID=84603 RepID=A0A9W8JW74_9AGAR|nr:hypothetical protein NLJ89_g9209 [Agrocybe chaxingu]
MGAPKMLFTHSGMSFINLRPTATVNIGVTASIFAAAKSNFIPDKRDASIASVIAATYVAGSVAYLARDFYSSTLFQDFLSRRYGIGEIIDADILLAHPEVLVYDAKVYGPACMRPSQLAAFEYERAIKNALNICGYSDGPGTDFAIVVQREGVCLPDDAPPVVDGKVFGPAWMRPSQLAAFEYERAINGMLPVCTSDDAPGKDIAVMVQGEGVCLAKDPPPVVDSKTYGLACARTNLFAVFMHEKVLCASGDGPSGSPRLLEVATRSASVGSSSSESEGDGRGRGDEPGNGSGGNDASGSDSRQPTHDISNSDGKKPPNKKNPIPKRIRNNDSPPPPPPPPAPPAVEVPKPTNNSNTSPIFAIIIGFVLGALCGVVLKSSYVKHLYSSIRARTRASKRSRRRSPTVILSRTTALLILAFMAFFYVDSCVNPYGRSLRPGEVISQPTSFVIVPQPRAVVPQSRRVVVPQSQAVVPQTPTAVVPRPLVTEPPMRLAIDKNYYAMDYRSMASTTARATSIPPSASDSLLDYDLMVFVLQVLALLIILYILLEVVYWIWVKEPMPLPSPKLVPIDVPQGAIVNPEQHDFEGPLSGISDNETLSVDARTEYSFSADSASDSDSEVPRQVIDKGKAVAVDEAVEADPDETVEVEEDEFVKDEEDGAEAESANNSFEVSEEIEEVMQMVFVLLTLPLRLLLTLV